MNHVELNAPVAQHGRKRQIAFYIVGGLFTLLFFGMLTFMVPLIPYAVTGWFSAEALGAHQIHDTMAAVLFCAILAGMLFQVRTPRSQVGGMQQTVAVLLGLNAVILLGNFFFPPMLIFLVLGILTAVLHPAGRRLLPKFERLNVPMLGLGLVAAVPLIIYAIAQIGLQRLGVPNDTHAEFGHWVVMAGYAVAIPLLALLAALRPSGWRVPAWSAGILAILFGLASLVMNGASAIEPLWGAAAILWGILFIGMSEKTVRSS